MKNQFRKKYFFFLIPIALFMASTVWSQVPSFNVPLEHPVYMFINMLPLPVVVDGVSISNRPFTEQQIATLLRYAKKNTGSSDKKIIDYYLAEFAETDSTSVKKVDVPIDGFKTHAYPYAVTSMSVHDSGFTKQGFDALGTKSLSSTVEGHNKTVAGGRLYSNVNGFLSYFDGAIITEYGSKEQWVKVNDPVTGRNYTTIMAEVDEPGNFIGYDDVTAYIKPPLKNVDISLGFDRLSWGYAGTSGLFFSGEGRPFLMAKASRTIGKLDYTFLIGKLTGDSYEQKRVIYAKHITYSPVPWFAFGLSDGIISVEKSLKPAYFLPFVPYYFVEHYIGGQDNRIMSFDAQCNLRQNVSLYGELYIDEISNLLGFVTNKKANDIWAGLIGIKWFNPVPQIPSSLLKAEFVQLEPWVYTRYGTVGGARLSNTPVDFGRPLGNQMGPHSRNVSLTFTGMLSEKINGSIGVSQYFKGDSAGSNILDGNDFLVDTINGTLTTHQLYSGKDYRFKTFQRNRTVLSVSGTYNFQHWLQAKLFGDYVREQVSVKKNYFQTGIEFRFNY